MGNLLFGTLMAALAYTLISTGIVLQKKGIGWMGWEGKKGNEYRSLLFVWITGFVLMNLFGIPSAIALKTLPAHVVSAFSGWGIISLILLSRFFLKEKLFRSDLFWSAPIIGGILLLNSTWGEKPGEIIAGGLSPLIYFAVPALLFMLTAAPGVSAVIKNGGYAIVSGCSAGIMVVSLKGLVRLHGFRVVEYPDSGYLYMYVFYAILSFISLQMSLRKGPALITGQFQYAFTIIYPVAGSIAVFGGRANALQFIAVAFIIMGITGIIRKR